MRILKADALRIIVMISEAKVIAMSKLHAKGYVNGMHRNTIKSANLILSVFRNQNPQIIIMRWIKNLLSD